MNVDKINTKCEVLNAYKIGWDSFWNENPNPFMVRALLWYAYEIGKNHAELGDENTRLDYLSDDEIIKIIYEAFVKGIE